MRLGLVKHLNAHPLDHGFRTSGNYELVEDTPSRLYEMLGRGELSAALISSVECLRNRHRFGYCTTVGVCCNGALKSILYFESKSKPRLINSSEGPKPPNRIYVDSGSRSSVALLQVLYEKEMGGLPDIQSVAPEEIPALVQSHPGTGGLLIGDAALRFAVSQGSDQFLVRDLGAWWKEMEGLPFVFALWAYPASAPLDDSLFEESLDTGLKSIEEIAGASNFSFAREYLTELLHYRLDKPEWLALQRFEERLQALDLL